MSDSNQDDTWEDFFGTSPDLMPSIMRALDAILDAKDRNSDSSDIKPAAPRRAYTASKFSNLSANVQKILSNLPDDEITSPPADHVHHQQKRFSRCNNNNRSYRYSPEKKLLQRSNESLDDIISPSVQKMLSNLPDNETVLGGEEKHADVYEEETKRTLQHSKSASSGFESSGEPALDCCFNGKPLGSYKQKSPSGIASRTPVGRKNMGKYLQIPSESTNSTSSEVSRPVSLTSLGSCSSSGSSGLHQQGSAYLASAESLDSDVEPTGSQGSADSGIAESTSSSPESRVLQEVLDTETVYVEDLRQVIHGYLEHWRNDPNCPQQSHLHHLFSNIEEIYEFNRSFLEQLRSASFDPTATANVFLHNDSGFTVYTEYCTNYPRTMDVLTELTRDEKTAMLFKQRQMSLGHPLPLGSYLLKPVQRILKYHLLLQRLSKQCDPFHKPNVDLALSTMTSVANHINTMKRKHEHAVRVQEIQSQLYGWNGRDLTALGELIAEGTFRVDGARGRRRVFLFDKLLLMAKSKPDGALAYKTHIMCSNLMLVEQVRGEPLCFHVLPFDNPRLQCTLRAWSVQQKKEWTLQIKRVILENYSAVIPKHARQLVMQLGQEVEETPEEQTEKWSPMKQHSTPQYLERRSRVRKTRDFGSRRAASQDRTFPSLGNWRRKSDPSGIQQYNTKTIPKKITKIKKAKECATVFYTDLSDSEICASMDSLDVGAGADHQCHKIYEDAECRPMTMGATTDKEIAQVVSDLLMQNEEFHKLINRRRRNLREPAGLANVWSSKCDERLPSKSDSLPRSFQLKEKGVDIKENLIESDCLFVSESSTSLQETISVHDDSQEIDNAHLEEEEDDFPEHKIYRKSQIRFSLVQRLRAMLNEEQKKSKSPAYKQGSRSMGAKLAHPDYADPQKLFANAPHPCDGDDKIEFDELDMLDMTINETEVLNELDKRLSESGNVSSQISGSKSLTHIDETARLTACVRSSSEIINSSQNSDSYYESLLDESLHEEERHIKKSDSFRSARDIPVITENLRALKRPTKAPPPIPVKPKNLNPQTAVNSSSNSCVNNRVLLFNKKIESCGSTVNNEHFNQNCKGWVKTIVDRFE